MKSYKKKKDVKNSPGPGQRTPDSFKIKKINKKPVNTNIKSTSFKTQHRGG